MNIIAIGINHKTAPIEIREKFYLNSLEQDLLLSELKCNPSVVEAFVLSTCNRIEIYANVLNTQNHFAGFVRLLADIKKIPFNEATARVFYVHADKDAVRHLLQVTSGLDSLVLGEKQILGQVKTAIERAQQKGMFTRQFNILTNIAIRTGKKVQTETDISYGGSSVSWAAVVMAEKLQKTLTGKKILIIGTGKMGEMAISQFHSKGVKEICLMNRTQSTAEILAAKYACVPSAFCDIKEKLADTDVAICSTDAPHYILDHETIEKVMTIRNHRPLTLMDISMPRNIDPRVEEIPGVQLADIDDLEKVVETTMQKRKESIGSVQTIIENKLTDFYEKLTKGMDPSLPAAISDSTRH